MNSVTVVSLGSGDPDLLNFKTVNALKSAASLLLRTGRHSVVSWLELNGIPFETFDRLYEKADDFDHLNTWIARSILDRAAESPVVYAVPDAPTDLSVRELFRLSRDPESIRVIPGVGSYDLYLSDALPFLTERPLLFVSASVLLESGSCDPNKTLLITELDNSVLAGQVKILLSETLEDEHPVFLLRDHLPTLRIPLYELDRQQRIDHRTAVMIPGSGFAGRRRYVLRDLETIMENLRSPQGCPWDRAQTHESLRPYLIEEAWECVASIDINDPDHLCEELGDLLFQIIFHASIGRTFDEFTLSDVIQSVCEKMIRRHPHVFGDVKCMDIEGVKNDWEQIKLRETGHESLTGSLEDVSAGLPSLKYAAKSLKKLYRADAFRRPSSQIVSDIMKTADRIRLNPDNIGESQLGHLLFLCSELCYCRGMDGEIVLHRTVNRMREKLILAEQRITHDGKSLESLTFDELCVYLRHVEGEIE